MGWRRLIRGGLPRLGSLATLYISVISPTSSLIIVAGLDEGLHFARALDGRVEQEGCVSRNRGLMPK